MKFASDPFIVYSLVVGFLRYPKEIQKLVYSPDSKSYFGNSTGTIGKIEFLKDNWIHKIKNRKNY